MSEENIHPGYLLGKLARALSASERHADPAVRARAAERALRLERALSGLLSGDIDVGSRTPTGAPAWATLEVVTGGFATGQLLAAGPLLPHEEALLARLPTEGTPRARLNAYHLGEEGLAALAARLRDGCYRVSVPEEGALLVVAWLIARGKIDRAHALLEPLAGWFDRLRFYPAAADSPQRQSAFVCLQPVKDTIASLSSVRVRPQIAKMNETLRVWSPLEDRLVVLLHETLDGEAPSVVLDPACQIVKGARGGPLVAGGVPLSKIPGGWEARARALLDEHRELCKIHTGCSRRSGEKSSLGRLVSCVEGALSHTEPHQKWQGIARTTLATIAHKRGGPDSLQRKALREIQASVAANPTSAELASVLVDRLSSLPGEGSIESLEPLVGPTTAEEAKQRKIREGIAIPAALEGKLERSLAAPVEDLVARGVIPSGEVLAIVAPQITSQVRAAGISDPELRRLYESIYSAFRRRRSLLLLHLQHQVRIEELPWVAAIDSERGSLGAEILSRQTLERLATLAITSFPDVILPNKLITELDALSKGALLHLPLTEELAADIFMGAFSSKFLSAAKSAARLLSGTLYERYYGLPFARVLAMPEPSVEPKRKKKSPASATPSAELAALCGELALAGPSGRWSVARNGTIIEQQQILTTHNLAVLFEALSLGTSLREELPELAARCFRSICRQHTQRIDDWRSNLLRLKSTAYAWRQMIFFLSIAGDDESLPFLALAREETPEPLRERFAPALRGLELAARGGRFGPDGTAEGGAARRFLGWTLGKHWLLG